MGQYQKHFYGSTLYGEMPAFFGQYTTEVFDAQEPFTGKIQHTLTCQLPYSTYRLNTYETTLSSGHWTVNSTGQATSNNAAATFVFKASGRSFEIKYKLQATGPQTITVNLKKKDGTIALTQDISTYSITTTGYKSFKFADVAYDTYTVEGSIKDGGTIPVIIDSFKVLTADVSIEVRASKDKATWSAWEAVPSTYTNSNGVWSLTGLGTTTHSGVRYIQGRLTLITSEETSAPVVDKIELLAGDSGLRAQNGLWTAVLNMNSIASASSATFKRATRILWNESKTGEGATVTVRSASSQTGDFYGATTAPYRKNTKRLRLKEGIYKHSVVIGPIDPSKKQQFWKTVNWRNWNDVSFLPKDESNVKVTYLFSKTTTNKRDVGNNLQEIAQPMKMENKNLLFKPQPFYLTVEMETLSTKGTPVVDLLNLYSMMEYKETKSIENKNVSSVDSNLTGKQNLQKISATTFTVPVTTSESVYNVASINAVPVNYTITDKTGRPTDVLVYLQSEASKSARTNVTSNKEDTIVAQVLLRQPELGIDTGVWRHYQYSGGSVQYLRPHEHEMEPTFTPSLNNSKTYRYYIMNGWPQETHVTVAGQTMDDVANLFGVTVTELQSLNPKVLKNTDGTLREKQKILIPNHSVNTEVETSFKNGTDTTEHSAHNARALGQTDLSTEVIVAEVKTSPTHNYVDWVSEEKIYNGVINENDIRGAYVRTQYNRSTSTSLERSYTIVSGDSWDSIAKKFDVNVEDLKRVNPDANMWTGVELIIPPNILLPTIPNGVEFEGDFPYEITVINNSVQKEDGTPLEETWIPIDWAGKHPPLEITYKVSDPVTITVTRGDIANGRDPLQHSGVINILRVQKTTGITFQKYDEDLKIGDYKLDGDYIDWSPAAGTSTEPVAGSSYYVTYTYNQVDKVVVHLDSTYEEETGVDNVWRSPEIKVIDGVCTPDQDAMIALPAKTSFEGYGTRGVEDYEYVIEDNDLWVETSLSVVDDKPYLIGSLKGKDPHINWFPLIKTGFYYLKENEYYMYSETLASPLSETEIPIAKSVQYEATPKDMGVLVQPARTNLITNSSMGIKSLKTAHKFTFKTT